MKFNVFCLKILLLFLPNVLCGLVATRMACISLDKNFADFDYCFLKAVNRSYKYISVKVKLFKVPITNISITMDVRKKVNGYKPFLYNITFDACKFLRERNNPVVNFAYQSIGKYTNMNHTCPFDHDLITEKLDIRFLENQLTNVLPVPDGEYGIFTTWTAYNIPRARVNVYGKIGK